MTYDDIISAHFYPFLASMPAHSRRTQTIHRDSTVDTHIKRCSFGCISVDFMIIAVVVVVR